MDTLVESNQSKNGKTTFSIRVFFRQNASFQGDIYWVEGEKRLSFRSFWEMVMLMQEALDSSGSPAASYELRSWNDEYRITGTSL